MFDTDDSPFSPALAATLRLATPDDAAAIARVNLDTWRVAYQGLLPRAYLDNLSLEKGEAAQRQHLGLSGQARFICEEGARCLGYAAAGENRVPIDAYDAELYGLYVHPAFQGLGLGSRLFKRAVQWLGEQGHPSLVVWVLEANPARAFYAGKGGQLLNLSRARRFGGRRLMEVAYGWKKLPLEESL